MTLVIGDLTLSKVKSFRMISEVRYPRQPVVGKSTGTIDTDAYVMSPEEYEIVCDINETDRGTLKGYLNAIKTISDADSGLSETVHVEKVECEYVIGKDFSGGSEQSCWRCTLSLVLSNS